MFTKTKIILTYLLLSLTLAACGGDAAPAPVSPTTAPETAKPAATSAPASEAAKATVTVAPTVAPAAAQPSGDAKEALLAAMRKQITGGPYRLKTSITTDKDTTEMNGEVVPPNQMHISIGSSDRKTEMIFIGDKGWMSQNGKWQISPIAGGEIMSQVLQNIDELASNISNVQYVGEESLDGKPAYAYTYHMELGADKGSVKSDAKVWIDSALGLVVKSESTGEFAGIKSKTVQIIEYDPSIKIEPPK